MSVQEIEEAITRLTSGDQMQIQEWLDQQLKARDRDSKLEEIKRQGMAEFGPVVGRRPSGLAAGEFTVPDDFDDPLPEDILRAFEGE